MSGQERGGAADKGSEEASSRSGVGAGENGHMTRKRSVHRELIDRFAAKADPRPVELADGEGPDPEHFRRFIRMAEMRKQQILERILMDED